MSLDAGMVDYLKGVDLCAAYIVQDQQRPPGNHTRRNSASAAHDPRVSNTVVAGDQIEPVSHQWQVMTPRQPAGNRPSIVCLRPRQHHTDRSGRLRAHRREPVQERKNAPVPLPTSSTRARACKNRRVRFQQPGQVGAPFGRLHRVPARGQLVKKTRSGPPSWFSRFDRFCTARLYHRTANIVRPVRRACLGCLSRVLHYRHFVGGHRRVN